MIITGTAPGGLQGIGNSRDAPPDCSDNILNLASLLCLHQILWNNGPLRLGTNTVIDADGYRPNVGIILTNKDGQVFWAKRVGQDAWQFPQGGIKSQESAEAALFRELKEEVGLEPKDVEIMACTRGWLRYRLPKRMVRYNTHPVCVGQKQKWFLLRLKGNENRIRFDCSEKPEFDGWRWVSYWYPLGQVVPFKRDVYRRAMRELAPRLFPTQESR